MRIIAAIDIIDGECVRLIQGDYEKKKTYNSDPLGVARKLEAHGIK
ncbi:MAG: HisA/HisF-related TIM barrel protein, partial [Bacteroidales bacterium]